MPKTLTATDRKSLIRLAATLPKGSDERKAILVGFQGGESHDGRQRQAYTREDGKEMDMDESAEHDPEAWDDYTDAMIGIEAGLKRLGFKVQGDAHGGDTEWDDDLQRWSTELDIQGPFGKARIDISGTVSKDRPGLERGSGFYTGIFRGGDWWDWKHLKHGEIEMDGGDPKRFVKKVLEVWADGGLNRTRKASSDGQALIRLASALPKGDKSRRAILAGLKSALKKVAKLETRRLDANDLERLGKARGAIAKYLGSGFQVVDDKSVARVDFVEDDPYAPNPIRDRDTTYTFGSAMGVGNAVLERHPPDVYTGTTLSFYVA